MIEVQQGFCFTEAVPFPFVDMVDVGNAVAAQGFGDRIGLLPRHDSIDIALEQRDPAAALQRLEQYDRLLPGDPGVTFLKGVSLEAMGNRQAAARQYNTFLRMSPQGGTAQQFAYSRLRGWGYLR